MNYSKSFMKVLEVLRLKNLVKYSVASGVDSYLTKKVHDVFKGTFLPYHNNHPKKVLFFPVQGWPNMMIVMESILAKALSYRNASCVMVACDRTLTACDLPFCVNDSKLLCQGCSSASKKIPRGFEIPCHYFGEFLTKDDFKEAERLSHEIDFSDYFDFIYEGINIGRQVYSSVLRYSLKGTIDDDQPTRILARRYFYNAILMTLISKAIIDRLQPDSVVMHHGIYLTTGIFADYARSRNVHVVVFTPAYRKGTFLFSHGQSYHKTLQDEPNNVWQNDELTQDQNDVLDQYLDSRRWGSQDFISYHPNPIEDRDYIQERLGLSPDKKIFGLFTNLVWDGQVVFFDNAFSNMTEWVMETIEYFIRHQDMQLVVRIHPAETKGAIPTQQKLYPLIKERFEQLPSNIKIIKPESDLSTYTLSEFLHAALVYTTKVGLEFAVKGIPSIVAGEAFYRNKGFTYDVTSKKQYFSLLDNHNQLKANDLARVHRARQYAYYYFFKRFIPMDFTINRTWNNILNIKLESPEEELIPGVNRYLDIICSGILNQHAFIINEMDNQNATTT